MSLFAKRLFVQQSRLVYSKPNFKLICGLEIHTQLSTKEKLFSLSTNAPFKSLSLPNSHVSYFDAALPGTRPRLNYDCVLNALKLGVSLNCEINLDSHFDRKHYFYGDQPQGYQLTQHYSPIASNGYLDLYPDIDGIDGKDKKRINIIQLQLEQDTGMSHYDEISGKTRIDLNRTNVPLIELVTKPDFTSVKEVIAFIKKYQNLIRVLNVSTGNLETGVIRVDVNVSVDEFPRIELKNLPNTSSISNAIKYEYKRQVDIIQSGKAAELLNCQETRGWDGEHTVKLRSKETTIDYRYMPDPELSCLKLDPSIIKDIQKTLPINSDTEIRTFMDTPYNLSVKNAKLLCVYNERNQKYTNEEVKGFYLTSFNLFKKLNPKSSSKETKMISNWLINEILGDLNKLELTLKDMIKVFPPIKFIEFLTAIKDGKISNTGGKKLLFYILENLKSQNLKNHVNLPSLITQLKIEIVSKYTEESLIKQCENIIKTLPDQSIIENIKSGKKRNSLNYLVGIAMRETKGTVKPMEFQRIFSELLLSD